MARPSAIAEVTNTILDPRLFSHFTAMSYRGPRPHFDRSYGHNMGGWDPVGGPFQNPGHYVSFEDRAAPIFHGGPPMRGWGGGPRFRPQHGPSHPRMPEVGLAIPEVLQWLDHQHPDVLHRIHFHIQWLFKQNGIVPDETSENAPEETSSWYENPDPAGSESEKSVGPKQVPPTQPQVPMQWTPGGWAAKDNAHKITSKMKPLPEPEVIPPPGPNFPDANDDRVKLDALKKNLAMMEFELGKTCRKFRIQNLDQEDLSKYPENQVDRLKTVITCVKAAEKTSKDYKEFLKTEKYKEWNEAQVKDHEEQIKKMIGDTPQGIPHKRPGAEDKSEDLEKLEPSSKATGSTTNPSGANMAFTKGDNLSIKNSEK